MNNKISNNQNIEEFEKEFVSEINQVKSLVFKTVETPEFQFPAYSFIYKKAMSIAFAVPAFAFVFAFFFYVGETNTINRDLAQIEASNTRILDQIDTLDYDNNL